MNLHVVWQSDETAVAKTVMVRRPGLPREYDCAVRGAKPGVPPRAVSFRLTVRQRLLWAVGSPVRCISFCVFLLFICWLGFISIGFSAVVVILAFVGFGHWIPFALSGRNRLVASETGLHDLIRFRKRTYLWSDIVRLHIASPAPFVHGLVVDVLDRSSGDVFGEFLRASWRPSRDEAVDLLSDISEAGWGPADVSPQPHITPPVYSPLIDPPETSRAEDERHNDRRFDTRASYDRRSPNELDVSEDHRWAPHE
jgi:hypothetical protein